MNFRPSKTACEKRGFNGRLSMANKGLVATAGSWLFYSGCCGAVATALAFSGGLHFGHGVFITSPSGSIDGIIVDP